MKHLPIIYAKEMNLMNKGFTRLIVELTELQTNFGRFAFLSDKSEVHIQ